MLEQLGLTSIRIELPFRLNHVNCFMAKGEHGWTIIDAGLNNRSTRAQWEKHIVGKEITDLVITHYHPDHFGYAGGLQQKTGARVSMTKIDEEAGLKAWSDEFLELISTNYKKAGIPTDLAAEMVANTTEFKQLVSPLPQVDHYIVEGEMISIGGHEYEVLSAPGHSDGMVCFYNKEKNVLLAADHILPRISPNISYWFHGDENPLASYLSSLKRMEKLEIDLVIPSHGKPFYGANERINEIIKHHDQRLDETLEAIRTDSTVNDVCGRIFHPHLTVHETRFAIGETLAHLEYLRHADQCERVEVDEQWVYRRK